MNQSLHPKALAEYGAELSISVTALIYLFNTCWYGSFGTCLLGLFAIRSCICQCVHVRTHAVLKVCVMSALNVPTNSCIKQGLGTFNYYKVLWYSFPFLPLSAISLSSLCGWLFHALFKSWLLRFIFCHSISPFPRFIALMGIPDPFQTSFTGLWIFCV